MNEQAGNLEHQRLPYMITALLPIKATSQRIPEKNFRVLGHKPLFRWVLETLLTIDAIDKIVINTDALEILTAEDLLSCDRLMIRRRKADLCGDEISMNKVLADDMLASDGDVFLMTHATNPFLSSSTIQKAISGFFKARASRLNDSMFSVNKIQTRFYREDGSPINHDPTSLIQTQDLEAWFEENSCLYLFSRESFMATKARIGKNPMMFETPRLESIDIDTPEDWELAEALAPARRETFEKRII